MDEFLTVAEIAEMLKLNQQTVRNMIDRGELTAVRVGQRRVRVRRSDLDAFLAAGTAKPEEPPESDEPPGQESEDAADLMATREPELGPLTELELRYLRKAIRYRLSKCETPPSGYNTGTIAVERRHELDKIADWFLRAEA